MNLFVLFSLLAVGYTQSSNSSLPVTSMTSSMPMSTNMASSTTANVSAAEYSITALPAVTGQPSCVYNCLVPIGLADPSGCDDVTNECACINAPADAMDALTGCIQTVCKSSTDAYASIITSLYGSYCQSVFGTMSFQQAISSNMAADAASASSASASSMATPASSATSSAASSTSSAKSDAIFLTSSFNFASAYGAIGAVLMMLAL